MIYELMNKIPRDSSYLTSEDVLTGTIFGFLRYFHNQSILIKYLSEAIDIFGNKLQINYDTLFRIDFWKKYYQSKDKSKYNEPDIILWNNVYDIVIECKYYSLLSENESAFLNNDDSYDNQLLRYSKIIEKSKKIKIIIYLTNDAIIPEKIMKKTRLKLEDNIQLYWLSWSSLYRVLKNNSLDCINHGEKMLRKDLLKFLRKRGMTLFCGFAKKTYKLKWKYKRVFTYGLPINAHNWEYNNEK